VGLVSAIRADLWDEFCKGDTENWMALSFMLKAIDQAEKTLRRIANG